MRIYRASSLGYSLEALVAPHLGFEPVNPPEFMQKAFDEGHRIEPLAIEKLRSLGWEIRSSQDEVTLEVIPERVTVVGHVDGIGSLLTQLPLSVVEIKSMAPQSWLAFKAKGWDAAGLIQKYKWQASAYMLATGLPHFMVAWNKETEELNTRFTWEPFYTISDIAAKLAQAEEYIEKGLVPEGCQDFPCPYYYLHPPKDAVEVTADETLEELLCEWKMYDADEKKAKQLKDQLRVQILALTGDATAAKIKGQCGVVVETYWQDEKEFMTKRKAGWITRVSGPRGKNGT